MKNLDLLESNTKSFIEKLTAQGGKPIYQLPVKEARQLLENLQSTKNRFPVEIEDKMILTPMGEISITITRPKQNAEALPVVVYCHGGGWILGSTKTHQRLMSEIASRALCAVVFINYTPSPEAKYPVAIEQAYAATMHIAENGSNLNLNTQQIVIAGDSVGGNMAAVVTLLAKERNGPKIAYQMLFYPVTDADFSRASYQQYENGPWLTKAAMEWFWNAYEPDVKLRSKYTITPLHASIDQLKHLPPALIFTAENDVLRDEGEAYAHKLIQAGVDVTALRFQGTIHDFLLLDAIAATPAPQTALALITLKLQQLFQRSYAGV